MKGSSLVLLAPLSVLDLLWVFAVGGWNSHLAAREAPRILCLSATAFWIVFVAILAGTTAAWVLFSRLHGETVRRSARLSLTAGQILIALHALWFVAVGHRAIQRSPLSTAKQLVQLDDGITAFYRANSRLPASLAEVRTQDPLAYYDFAGHRFTYRVDADGKGYSLASTGLARETRDWMKAWNESYSREIKRRLPPERQ